MIYKEHQDPLNGEEPSRGIQDLLIAGMKNYMVACYEMSRKNGFWDHGEGRRDPLLKLFLMVTELAEAGEAIRAGKELEDCDKKIGLTNIEEEMADIVIRIFDFCAAFRIDLPRAIILKHRYNRTRPFRHGKTC